MSHYDIVPPFEELIADDISYAILLERIEDVIDDEPTYAKLSFEQLLKIAYDEYVLDVESAMERNAEYRQQYGE